MRGWKTRLGGLGAIFTGAARIIQAVSTGDFGDVPEGVALIAAGFSVLGLGGKLDKLEDATRTPEPIKAMDARNKEILDR